mmetsp:Transcript_10588/g.34089  ORF Transcript_10588/g.34089 Transcript_10588/m.34089 type:complete len:214 (+) Transcript_10588:317-958(+)
MQPGSKYSRRVAGRAHRAASAPSPQVHKGFQPHPCSLPRCPAPMIPPPDTVSAFSFGACSAVTRDGTGARSSRPWRRRDEPGLQIQRRQRDGVRAAVMYGWKRARWSDWWLGFWLRNMRSERPTQPCWARGRLCPVHSAQLRSLGLPPAQLPPPSRRRTQPIRWDGIHRGWVKHGLDNREVVPPPPLWARTRALVVGRCGAWYSRRLRRRAWQ